MEKITTITRTAGMILLFAMALFAESTVAADSALLERVVAIVDYEIVLLSEFRDALDHAEESGEQLSEEDVIHQMINRIVLLREAGRLGLKRNNRDRDGDDTIKEFVDRRIKAFIHIPYGEIESYYNDHDDFHDSEFYDVKDEIEKILVSRELVKRLREYVEEQRRKSYIRIQLKE